MLWPFASAGHRLAGLVARVRGRKQVESARVDGVLRREASGAVGSDPHVGDVARGSDVHGDDVGIRVCVRLNRGAGGLAVRDHWQGQRGECQKKNARFLGESSEFLPSPGRAAPIE